MTRLSQFFEDHNGQLSAMRLYCFVALIVAVALSFIKPINFGLVVTWLTAAFAPKAIQKPIELYGGGKK